MATFADVFAGTGVVARHFKRKGFRVVANDLMTYSYVLLRAEVAQSQYPRFKGPAALLPVAERLEQLGLFGEPEERAALRRVIAYLDSLPGVPGFCHDEYAPEGSAGRRYFTGANAARIDAVREQIEEWWRAGLLTEDERVLLVAAVVEAVPFVANVTGTFGAFLKTWDPRAHKPLRLREPEIVPSDLDHEAHQTDANALVKRLECDVLYLDPPYNVRQYATNYHVLETIAAWDRPRLRGKTGLRPADERRSAYCEASSAGDALADLAAAARCRLLLLSYNSDGLLPERTILQILGSRGTVAVRRRPYRRFRSDADGPKRRYREGDIVSENLYVVPVDNCP
ncbi:MAG: DNA adenine methylase [Chloroflexi bacterium]|nr:DNA adenine methylase [Chloroflexota bacterium]